MYMLPFIIYLELIIFFMKPFYYILSILLCFGCQHSPYKKEAIKLNNQATQLFLSNPDSALLLFDKATALDTNYHLPIQNKANLLIGLDRFEEALATIEQLIAKKEYAEAWQMKGMLLDKLGQKPKEAHRAYQKSLSVQQERLTTIPESKKAMENMSIAITYFLMADTSKAKTLILENKNQVRDFGLGDSILKYMDDKKKIIDLILK